VTDLRYPIGKFHFDGPLSDEQKTKLIGDIASAPAELRAAVKGLSQQQFDTPYRDGGWTVRQVVHHLPDGHLNAYVRFKLALTEDEPAVNNYAQDRWANLADTGATPIEVSLAMMDSLHDRWVRLLRSFTQQEWKRTFRHPEIGVASLEQYLVVCAWHGKHHVAHITSLRKRNNW